MILKLIGTSCRQKLELETGFEMEQGNWKKCNPFKMEKGNCIVEQLSISQHLCKLHVFNIREANKKFTDAERYLDDLKTELDNNQHALDAKD